MGAATSTNVANTFASAINQIATDISDNIDNKAVCELSATFKNCTIWGDVNIKQACKTYAVSKQVVENKESNDLKNLVAQVMTQLASSNMGFGGLGFADANNTANAFASSTNSVLTSLNATCNNVTENSVNVSCDGSTIQGNVTIEQWASSDFFTEQTITSGQANQLSNQITQTIQQKATATVEGISALAIALAIFILGFLYLLEKPFTTLFSNQLLMVTLLFLVVGAIFGVLWFFKVPPIFDTPDMYAAGGFWAASQCKDVVNPTNTSITIANAPLRYMAPIYDPTAPGLFQMAIAVLMPTSFDGSMTPAEQKTYYDNYTQGVSQLEKNNPKLASFFNHGPQILIQTSTGYGPNDAGWTKYLQSADNDDLMMARTVLIAIVTNGGLDINDQRALGIKLDPKISGIVDEYTPDNCDNVLIYTPGYVSSVRSLLYSGLPSQQSSGKLSGSFGYCGDSNSYKVHNWLYNDYGFYIILGVFIFLYIAILLAILFRGRSSSSVPAPTKEAEE